MPVSEQQRRSTRILRLLAKAAVGGIALAGDAAAADTTSSWNNASGGVWTSAVNWLPNTHYPNNGTPIGIDYQANVSLAGKNPYTITENGTIAVDGLSISSANATLLDSAGTLTVGAATITSGFFLLNGGALSGGVSGAIINVNSPGRFEIAGGTLDDLTFTGSNLNFSGGTLNISRGLNLSGNSLNLTAPAEGLNFNGASQTIDDLAIDGATNMQFVDIGGLASSGPVTLTLGPHALLHGTLAIADNPKIAGNTVVNNGTINADVADSSRSLTLGSANFTNNAVAEATNGAILAINSSTWTNAAGGAISAAASTLTFAGSWSNAGGISTTGTSTVNLGGSFTAMGLGAYAPSLATTTNITGTLDLSGGSFDLSAYPGIWQLNGGTIKNGALSAAGSALTAQNGALDAVTGGAPAGTLYTTDNLTIKDGLSFGDATIATHLNNPNSITFDGPSETINHVNILLTLVANYNNQINVGGPSSVGPVTVTLGPGAVIQGVGSIGNGNTYANILVNNGTINANLPKHDLTITPGGFTNNGQMQANTGTLQIAAGNWSNSSTGSITAAGSTVLLGGTWSNAGSVSIAAGSALNLSGTSWTNTGGITADTNSTISFSSPQWTNLGSMTAQNGATINITTTNWSNSGTMSAIHGGIFDMGGTFTTAGIGTFTASADSTVNLTGTLNNSRSTLKPASYGGTWTIDGTINGGTLDVSGSPVSIGIAALNGVHVIGGDLTLNQPTESGLAVSGGLFISTGNLNLVGPGAGVGFVGAGQTIDNLNINADSNDDNHFISVGAPYSSGQVTFASHTTISGGNLYFNDSYSGSGFPPYGIAINNGTIKSDIPGDTVNINTRYFTNNGVLEATNGAALSFGGTTNFTNAGTLALHGATLTSINDLSLGGTLTGSGTINANLALTSEASQLALNIGGTVQGSGYDSLIVNGNVALAGDLDIAFAGGFQNSVTFDEQFIVMTLDAPATLGGSFLNVADGGRLSTTDGYGSFQVNYGSRPYAREIVLSDFQAVPEPAGGAALLLAAAILLRRRKHPTGC